MKRKLLILLVTVVCLTIVGGKLYEMSFIPVYNYGSLTTSFQFECYPTKGRTIEFMDRAKVKFDSINSCSTVICRKFPKNYLKVWNLYDYWKSPYYQFPGCE